MITNTATFASRSEAQAIISQLDRGTYYLSHGEYARPHYAARKVRGEDHYYIHAKRYFYAGTFNATPSGPISEEIVYWLETSAIIDPECV